MLSVGPEDQYLPILLIGLVAHGCKMAATDTDITYTVQPARLLAKSPALSGNTFRAFPGAQTAHLVTPSCKRDVATLLSFFASIVKHGTGCETVVLAILLVTEFCQHMSFPRGWTLLSVYLNSVHEGLSEVLSLGDLNTSPTLWSMSVHCSIN